MPTKRFAWKDRDSAALDLIQLVYHAPHALSQDALYILSAIRSPVIVPDLKAITFDAEREIWERIYALRALANVPGDVYFPELAAIAKNDLLTRERLIAQSQQEPYKVFIPTDVLEELIAFASEKQSNIPWLLELFDRADPRVVCRLYSDRLGSALSPEMSQLVLHRLIALLEDHLELLTLNIVRDIYGNAQLDETARAFLEQHFESILQKAIIAVPSPISHTELSPEIPFDWPELKAAIFRLRPDFEEKYLRDEVKAASKMDKIREKLKEDLSYQETAIWHELEALYESARDGNNRARRELYHNTRNERLGLPARAAATHFLGMLGEVPGVTENLTILVQRPCDSGDMWERYYSRVRFVAGLSLFRIGTPQAWEALIAACFVGPSNFLETFLLEWINALTDKLSGIQARDDEDSERYSRIQNRWFKALVD